jgi:hypothetical protein
MSLFFTLFPLRSVLVKIQKWAGQDSNLPRIPRRKNQFMNSAPHNPVASFWSTLKK